MASLRPDRRFGKLVRAAAKLVDKESDHIRSIRCRATPFGDGRGSLQMLVTDRFTVLSADFAMLCDDLDAPVEFLLDPVAAKPLLAPSSQDPWIGVNGGEVQLYGGVMPPEEPRHLDFGRVARVWDTFSPLVPGMEQSPLFDSDERMAALWAALKLLGEPMRTIAGITPEQKWALFAASTDDGAMRSITMLKRRDQEKPWAWSVEPQGAR